MKKMIYAILLITLGSSLNLQARAPKTQVLTTKPSVNASTAAENFHEASVAALTKEIKKQRELLVIAQKQKRDAEALCEQAEEQIGAAEDAIDAGQKAIAIISE